METLTVNLTGATRRKLQGRDYLVASGTSLVEGVLPGSNGPLFYPKAEFQKNPQDWNDLPIVKFHPTLNGQHVSARDHRVIDAQAMGRVYNTAAEETLRHEFWFDEQLTRERDPDTYRKLQSGEPVEVSTGLYTRNEPVANDGKNVHNGRQFTHVARDYKPDHVAVLPGLKGACPNEMGCGVNVNEAADRLLKAAEQLTVNAGKLLGKGCPCGGTCAKCRPPAKSSGLKEAVAAHNARSLPSAKADISPEKACTMLKEDQANGRPLSDKQKGMLGALCGKRKKPTGNLALAVNAFCATGEGGGQDNSCSAGGARGGEHTPQQKQAVNSIKSVLDNPNTKHFLATKNAAVLTQIASAVASDYLRKMSVDEVKAVKSFLTKEHPQLAKKIQENHPQHWTANAKKQLAAAVSDYLAS